MGGPNGPPTPPISQAEAAKLMGVHVRTLKKANRVQKQAVPEVKALVEKSDLSLNKAA